jgi:KUP system potassium uptake protein
MIDEIPRVEGTAIYLASDYHQAPIALRRTLHHFGVIHNQVAILEINYELAPYVAEESRTTITRCDKGFVQIKLKYGFMERASIPDALTAHFPEDIAANLEPVSYFANRLVIFQDGDSGMRAWRKQLFRFMYRNAQHPTDFLRVPAADSMSVSIRVSI